MRKKVLPNDHLITDDKTGKFVKGTSQCYVPPHAKVGSQHCQHLEKVIKTSSFTFVIRLFWPSNQTKLQEYSKHLQNSCVPPLSPENWGFPLGLREVHRRSGCSSCSPQSHTWLVSWRCSTHETEWHMHHDKKNVSITPLLIFSRIPGRFLLIFIINLQTRQTSWHFLGDMIDPCSELQQLFLCVRRAAALAFEVKIVNKT